MTPSSTQPEALFEAAEVLQEVEARPRRWKPYDSYTDSGFDTLGRVPKHWNIKRLRFTSEVNPVKSEVADLPPDTEISFVPMESVHEYGGLTLDRNRYIEDVYDGYTYFRDDDIIVAKITPCFENGKGSVALGLTNGIGFGTTELHVLRAGSELDRDFLFFLTISHRFRRLGESEMYGAGGQKRVPERFLSDFRTQLPPLEEQRAIAAFLRRETAKIDALVEKKRRLIDLLKEKRTALISHAVTKGLDPSISMKLSGVEWFDDVPSGWTVGRLKHFVPGVTVGIVIQPSKLYERTGIPCLRSLNISGQSIDLDSDFVFISDESNRLHSKSITRTGDLVVVRTGKTGATAVVTEQFDGANCVDLVIIRRSPDLLSQYLHYYINSLPATRQVDALSVGSLQAHYNTRTVGELLIPIPPTNEQEHLLEYLDEETGKLERVVRRAVTAIAQLSEYRAALVSAAVTGKIDVRGEVSDG